MKRNKRKEVNMTSKEYELIKEMLQMQAKLDDAIMKEYGLTEIDEKKLTFAILDEVGELTHELKSEWCWWKKSQPKVDKQKVLEELVDVWHFVLSWQNHFRGGMSRTESQVATITKVYLREMKEIHKDVAYMLVGVPNTSVSRLEKLCAITEYLGFKIEQVYEAYVNKNKINYQRLKEGY